MRWRYAATIVLALLVGPHCQSGASEAGAATREKAPDEGDSGGVEAIPVETMKVSTTEFRETSTVPGTTSPVDTTNVSVEQPGRIERLTIEEGDDVQKGERLLKLETEIDRARIKRLENAVKAAKREFERTQNLRDDDLATPRELDRARTELRDAELQLEEAQVGLDKATVRSPTSGVILDVRAEEGEQAAPGRPLATIADLSTIEVTASVPASRIGVVQEGDSVDVEISPLGETVSGTIARRPPAVDSDTRTYPVEIHLDNEEGRIRPGMQASMTLTRQVWTDAVVIPRTTVLQGYERQEIAVVPQTEDDQPEQALIRRVQLGPSAGNRVVVTEGLEAGERLVVRGHRSLMEEAPVQIVGTYEGLQEALEAGL